MHKTEEEGVTATETLTSGLTEDLLAGSSYGR